CIADLKCLDAEVGGVAQPQIAQYRIRTGTGPHARKTTIGIFRRPAILHVLNSGCSQGVVRAIHENRIRLHSDESAEAFAYTLSQSAEIPAFIAEVEADGVVHVRERIAEVNF